MKKYLIGIRDMELEECDMAIINANSKEDDIEKYISNIGIESESFLDDVYSIMCNASYAEQLFVDTNGNKLFDINRESKYSNKEIEEFFIMNVKKLFEGHEDWYNLYMKLYNDEDVKFPKEMLIHMGKKDRHISNDLLCMDIEKDIRVIS